MSHLRSSAAHAGNSADYPQTQPQPEEMAFRSGSGMTMFFVVMLVLQIGQSAKGAIQPGIRA
jgi:cellobiose-specific phosphotransferase system component IIC